MDKRTRRLTLEMALIGAQHLITECEAELKAGDTTGAIDGEAAGEPVGNPAKAHRKYSRKTPATPPVETEAPKVKRGMSPAARSKQAKVMRKRWRDLRASGRNKLTRAA